MRDELSTAKGMPETAEDAGITRTEDGQVKPTQETATRALTELKLQDPALVKA